MISVKCPHCNVGLKVDEGKLPLGISSFNCPKCKQSIPISFLHKKESEAETILLHTPLLKNTGKISVLSNEETSEQVFLLQEGIYVIGRESKTSKATIRIQTMDRSMSREHIRIEVKKDSMEGYKHYLSDNNSKNQTLYNNNYLRKGEVVVLSDNDEITLGRTTLRFNL